MVCVGNVPTRVAWLDNVGWSVAAVSLSSRESRGESQAPDEEEHHCDDEEEREECPISARVDVEIARLEKAVSVLAWMSE